MIVRTFLSSSDVFHRSAYLVRDKIYVTRRYSLEMTCYDAGTGDYIDFALPLEAIRAAVVPNGHPQSIHETVFLENGIDTIETLLRTPPRRYEELLADWIASPDGRAGERIYQYVKDMLWQERM